MLSKLVTLKSYVFTFIVLTFFTVSSLNAFDISKNASKGNFEVTSWKAGGGYSVITVSYTHLTLPTKRIV